VLAAGLQDWIDFGVIVAILLMNAIVGVVSGKVSCTPQAPHGHLCISSVHKGGGHWDGALLGSRFRDLGNIESVSADSATTTLRQAGDIVARLKAGIAMKCTVVRDGKEQEVQARDLVPDDIMILEEGETIAADAKVS